MLNLTWEVPFGIFFGLSIARLFLAPYWLDQDREKEISDLKRKIDNLKSYIDHNASRHTQRETLARFITKGIEIRKTYETLEHQTLDAATNWDWEVCTYLRHTFGYDYAVLFQRPNEYRCYDLNKHPSHISKENYEFYLFFNMRIHNLEKLIVELKDK